MRFLAVVFPAACNMMVGMKFKNAAIRSVCTYLPPNVMTSEELEHRLAPVYDRLKLPYGRLEMMSGIAQRRFWEPGTRPSTVAAQAGEKALRESGIAPEKIGCLIHASVCRDFMEPATAAVVHDLLRLPPECMIFDLSNACLGVLNGIVQLATMIDAGQIEAGLVVSGEVAEPLCRATIKAILADKSISRKSFKNHFASLTIGSGAAGVVVALADGGGHRLLGGALRTDSTANRLCQEDSTARSESGPLMSTDSEALLHAGCRLAGETWQALKLNLGWSNDTPNHIFTHQVGLAHRKLLFEVTGLDMERDFPTVSRFGNTGSAALPTALACGSKEKGIKPGEKVALLGIGSGLSSLMLGLEW